MDRKTNDLLKLLKSKNKPSKTADNAIQTLKYPMVDENGNPIVSKFSGYDPLRGE